MAIFVVVILLWNTFQTGKPARHELKFSDFDQAVERGRVTEVTLHGQQVTGKFKAGGEYADGDEFHTQVPTDYSSVLIPKLRAAHVDITVEEPKENPLFAVLVTWAPVLLLVVLWVFFMRQMQTGGNKALSFGKSKAKLLSTSGKKVTFKDVAGVEEAKEELSEIVEFLKEPQKFNDLFELFLGLIHAGNVLKRHLLLLHRQQACPALAEGQRLVAAALHLPQHEEPQRADDNDRREVQQDW